MSVATFGWVWDSRGVSGTERTVPRQRNGTERNGNDGNGSGNGNGSDGSDRV